MSRKTELFEEDCGSTTSNLSEIEYEMKKGIPEYKCMFSIVNKANL